MKHYDEFTLELFAINSETVADKRDEFEQHIKNCHRCNKFYNEIVQFYEIARGEAPALPEHQESEESSIMLRPQYLRRREYWNIFRIPRSVPARIWNFVYRRPIRTVAGTATVLGLLYFALSPNSLFKDTNPEYTKTNDSTGMLEIYNKDGEKLWQLRWKTEINRTELNLNSISWTKVVDLNSNGKNDVISVLPYLDNEGNKPNLFYIFDSKKNLIVEKELGEPFYFRGKSYFPEFRTYGLIIDDFEKNGNKEIFVNLRHSHSPWVLMHLDKKGNIIGEYWHFGHFMSMFSMDLDNDSKKEIILSGSEDIDNFGVIAVLDPEKIKGNSESSVTPGFNFPMSKAEKYYIQLPHPPGVDPVRFKPTVYRKTGTSNDFSFISEASDLNGPIQNLVLYFYFSKDMRCLEVMLTDQARDAYKSLIKEGTIKKMPDQKYLDDLKKEIKYWDGKEWKKEWTMINNQ